MEEALCGFGSPLTLVFLSLAVDGLFLHRSFMVKEAPLHLQVFVRASLRTCGLGNCIFFLGPLLYAERSNRDLRFHRSSNDYESCWENETCNFDFQYSHLKKNSSNSFRKLQESSKNWTELMMPTHFHPCIIWVVRNVLVSISLISFLCTVGRTWTNSRGQVVLNPAVRATLIELSSQDK